MSELLVLVEQAVWDDFVPAVDGVGERFAAASGRTYRLSRAGHRLEVYLERDGSLPSGDEIDTDLFELACVVYDAVGGEWSSEALRQTTGMWGWSPISAG